MAMRWRRRHKRVEATVHPMPIRRLRVPYVETSSVTQATSGAM